jgi:hypothetical protein
VFRFGHRPETVEPEQAYHGTGEAGEAGPDATGSVPTDSAAGGEPQPVPEQGVLERGVGSNAGAVSESGLAAAGAIITDESRELDGDGNVLAASVRTASLAAVESTATGLEEREGSDDASTVDGSGGEEAAATAGSEETEEVSEGSTAQDLDTDVDTESSGSSSDEQGAELRIPLQTVVCVFSNSNPAADFRCTVSCVRHYHHLLRGCFCVRNECSLSKFPPN